MKLFKVLSLVCLALVVSTNFYLWLHNVPGDVDSRLAIAVAGILLAIEWVQE